MNAAEPRGVRAAQGGVEKLQMGDGRAALAKAMELGSSDPEVDGQTFDKVVTEFGQSSQLQTWIKIRVMS